jgi:mannose-6-phosphate isomerase-like protein (cupin superfamily)
MKRFMPAFWLTTTMLAFLAGYAIGPVRSAGQAAQGGNQQAPLAGALPPGDYSKMQLAPDQGEPFLFSGAEMRKAHTEMQARAAKSGGAVSNPRDLMKPAVTRTHSFILMHRPELKTATAAPNAEQHEGATDVYFVVAGSGTVTVGGSIDNKRIGRPGEYTGPINGGKAFKLAAGDILDIPPNMPHATVPDAGGMTYVLMKVNVGLYPWSLINGTP